MFRQLVNEAKLEFTLTTASPLAIRSGMENVLEPARPDMQCVRAWRDGQETVYIPGSSLKGVIRARAEQIINLLGGAACSCTNRQEACSGKEKELEGADATRRYREVCPACRIFGSTIMAGRAAFPDAYPISPVKVGERTRVAINRLTGGSQGAALFQQEVVEEAVFRAGIILTNYELWQLRLLLWVLGDMHEGYVALGGGSTRGFGRMHVGALSLTARDYRPDQPRRWRGREEADLGEPLDFSASAYFWEAQLAGDLQEVEARLAGVDVRAAVTGGDRYAR